MPAPIENVDHLVVIRDLHDDENLVIKEFERHARRCSLCSDPLQTHKQGRNLCERGRPHALDVEKYLYSKNNKHFSVVDQENGKSMRVKLPHNNLAVRSLLAAIEDGLLLSHDRTYPVSSRRPVIQQIRPRSYSPAPVRPRSHSPDPAHEIIEREPRRSKHHVIVYHSPRGSPSRGSPSRGSLYHTDRMDRVERRYESSRVYRPSDYRR
ncbi:hypothetical protein NUU61_003128 [Penicillium alfredii]|uniref:Uncharacterized protein n=1 Tax=Penicillium alfredii TaxID=1506179 RepID=A0A9W9KH72_9EURO|nr:uncharacterized protein NUU61_003128 [Penicillium alfredii]KAJ5105781.1 hypothetical protein NUU61_003128 [Penicillium alfredii]